jgi:superfamily II RNA helicase
MEKNYDPVIIFAFSKRECEALAASMHNLDLNNEDQRYEGADANSVGVLLRVQTRDAQLSALQLAREIFI